MAAQASDSEVSGKFHPHPKDFQERLVANPLLATISSQTKPIKIGQKLFLDAPIPNPPSPMKTALVTSVLLITLTTAQSFAQGSLKPPPGPPAPTMKTLEEIWDKIGALEKQNGCFSPRLPSFSGKSAFSLRLR